MRLYRSLVNLDRCRCWEVSRQLLRKVSRKWSSTDIDIETAVEEGIEEMVIDKYRYRGGVEEQSIRCKNRSSIYPQLSRSYREGRSFLDLSTRYREAVEIAIRKSLRSSTDSKVSRKYWASFFLKKSSFSKSEKHRHECNPTYNSTNDPNTIKTHTHTLNKSNQFYFQKQVKTV